MLENYLRNRLKTKPILLMTHMVVGYPSLGHLHENGGKTMVRAGVDIMELQISFLRAHRGRPRDS